jgi:hypothetical protein
VRLAGRVIAIVGALAFIAFVALLPYQGAGAFGHTLWSLTTREPAIVTGVAAAVIISAIASVFTSSAFAPALTACLSFYLCGQWFNDGRPNYTGLSYAFTLATVATVVMAFGGLLTLVGYRLRRGPGTSRLDVVDTAPLQQATGVSATPPAGWYPDPAQPHLRRERYWDARQWTEHTRGSSGG